jgi:hypothetical protein
MILRIIGTGLLLKAAIGVMAVAAGGAGVVLLACAAKRRAQARAAWPAEEEDAARAEQ